MLQIEYLTVHLHEEKLKWQNLGQLGVLNLAQVLSDNIEVMIAFKVINVQPTTGGCLGKARMSLFQAHEMLKCPRQD